MLHCLEFNFRLKCTNSNYLAYSLSGKPSLCSELRSLNISCLQEHEEVLLEELDPLHISDLLFEERAIEIVEHDTITEFEYRRLQITNLLKTVKENKNDCFHFFLYILQNEEYVCIREKLERPVPEASRAGMFNYSYNTIHFLKILNTLKFW